MDLIKSKDNPNIKMYQKLLASKKYRRQYGMFVLEGLRIFEDAIKENAVLHCVFITQSAFVKYGEALNLLVDNNDNKYPVYYITDELGEKISDTSSSQGIFAVALKDMRYTLDTIKKNGRYMILANLQDPGNIGTIIRTADAVGIDAVILCECCDLYNPKVIRSTMGSIFRVPILDNQNITEVIEFFKKNNTKVYASVVESNAVSLTNCDFSISSAVVIGNEGSGLTGEISEMCNEKITIKMTGNIDSLNAAMASVIIMWEMGRDHSG